MSADACRWKMVHGFWPCQNPPLLDLVQTGVRSESVMFAPGPTSKNWGKPRLDVHFAPLKYGTPCSGKSLESLQSLTTGLQMDV
mmetsp:Transcript_23319/g.42054  ORF Transcript_23319/g.42054 Transcript_23319/m.42054 type:complete len:84 (+) Transcript_23319:42-293(+)